MLTMVMLSLGPFYTNCYLICEQNEQQCVVIDPGVATSDLITKIRQQLGAQRNYNRNLVILLTHGHFDHIGAVQKLLSEFNGSEAYICQEDMTTAQDQQKFVTTYYSSQINVYNFEDFDFSLIKSFEALNRKDLINASEKHILEKLEYQIPKTHKNTGMPHDNFQNIKANTSNIISFKLFNKYTLYVIKTPGHTPGSMVLWFPEQNWLFTGDTLFSDNIGRYNFPGGSKYQLQQSIKELKNTFNASLKQKIKIFPGHGTSATLKTAIDKVSWFIK